MPDRMRCRIATLVASLELGSLAVGSYVCCCLALFGCGGSSPVGTEAQDHVGETDATPADALTEGASETGPSTAPNRTCEDAAEIVENAAGFGNAATVFGDLSDGEPSPFPLACSNTTGLGKILYYHANVPTGSSLMASARRNDLGEPLPIHVASSCASRQCVAEGVGQVRYSNVGTATIDVIIKVGSGNASGPLPFELQVAILPLATNADASP